MVRAFQQVNLALRYAAVPVVVAPAGLALGGGCEIVLHGDRVQAAAESYIGLVEVGVGLIPAGGGTKEMMAARARRRRRRTTCCRSCSARSRRSALPRCRRARRTRGELGYLRDVDGITMNRERLMADAKAVALERVREGYRPPPRRTRDPCGRRERCSRR